MFGFLRRGPPVSEADHVAAPLAPPPSALQAPGIKASAVGRIIARGAAGGAGMIMASLTPRDSTMLVRAGYIGNPVAHRAIRLIAEAAAALPLVLEEAGRPLDRHPVLDLIARPNAGQSRVEFLEALYGQILLSGNAFVEAVVSGGEAADGVAAGLPGDLSGALPEELHVLRSDRITVLPGTDGWPAAYDYTVAGRKHRFALGSGPAPVCQIRSFHPQDDHYGLSPLQAAAQAIEVHNAASRWSRALLDNAARPSGALVYRGPDGGGNMTNDQYDRLVSEIEANHQGARNAGRPMLLEGGLDWKPMGFSPSDMEFHRTKEAAAREIAIAFGVPPMMLGIPGDATYANYQEAGRAFYRLTVLPLAGRVLGALANWLEDFSGEVLVLRPDPDLIPALSPERDAHWARIAGADFLDPDEKRRLLGLPERAAEPVGTKGGVSAHPLAGTRADRAGTGADAGPDSESDSGPWIRPADGSGNDGGHDGA